MKHTGRIIRFGAVLGGSVMTVMSGCGNLLRSNLLLGAREGAVTTTTGIIDGFLENRFGLVIDEEGGDVAAQEMESGNGLFVHV